MAGARDRDFLRRHTDAVEIAGPYATASTLLKDAMRTAAAMLSHGTPQPSVGNGENGGSNLAMVARSPRSAFPPSPFWKARTAHFAALFASSDALSTLPRTTTATTMFSLSLRLNLRVLTRSTLATQSTLPPGTPQAGISPVPGKCSLLAGVVSHNTPLVMHSRSPSRETPCSP